MSNDDFVSPSHFDFLVIDDTKYLEDSYALRYKIYCKETGFLCEDDYPEQKETDVFDEFSIHVGAVTKTGLLVGTVRLVLPSHFGFPLFNHCALFDKYNNLTNHDNPQFTSGAEISRLVLEKSQRRRAGDGLYGLSEIPKVSPIKNFNGRIPDRRHRPEIVLGLYKMLYQESKRSGITHWYAAMEKSLLRLLHRYKFGFKPIGPEGDYYGPVTPYLSKIADLEYGIRKKYPELYSTFVEGLESRNTKRINISDVFLLLSKQHQLAELHDKPLFELGL